jgi:hypothetical protein
MTLSEYDTDPLIIQLSVATSVALEKMGEDAGCVYGVIGSFGTVRLQTNFSVLQRVSDRHNLAVHTREDANLNTHHIVDLGDGIHLTACQ